MSTTWAISNVSVAKDGEIRLTLRPSGEPFPAAVAKARDGQVAYLKTIAKNAMMLEMREPPPGAQNRDRINVWSKLQELRKVIDAAAAEVHGLEREWQSYQGQADLQMGIAAHRQDAKKRLAALVAEAEPYRQKLVNVLQFVAEYGHAPGARIEMIQQTMAPNPQAMLYQHIADGLAGALDELLEQKAGEAIPHSERLDGLMALVPPLEPAASAQVLPWQPGGERARAHPALAEV